MKVLIILTTYNGEKYIIEQINSILHQKDVDFELNIFDDNSLDNTISLCESFTDSRIKIYRNKINSGSAAINFINALCSLNLKYLNQFDYISFSDQDDIWHEDKLCQAIKELKENNADLYASNLTMWNMKNNKYSILIKSQKQQKYDFLFEGASAGCTYVFSLNLCKSFINLISEIDLNSWKYISHDWLLYFFARINNYIVYIDPRSYITYRIHDSNVHGSMNIISLDAFLKKIKLINSGWFFIHSKNFKKYFLKDKQIEYFIYSKFLSSWQERFQILIKYNFKLFRSKKKFLFFLLFNILNFKKSH